MRAITQLILVIFFLSILQPAIADDRCDALLNDFLFFCTVKTPDFDQLDQTAKSLNLKVKKEIHPTLPPGQSARSKGWFVGDKTGTYELSTSEAVNGNKTVTACGIGAPDALGSEMLSDITTKMHLSKPDGESILPNGQMKAFQWKIPMGKEQMLLSLVHAYPKGPGLYLSIVREVESNRAGK